MGVLERRERSTADTAPATLAVCAQWPWARVLAGIAFAVSRAMLFLMVLAIARGEHAITPVMVIRSYVYFFVLPALVAWLLVRAAAARVTVGAGALRIVRPDVRVEVPLDAVARLVPWRLPLPGPGFDVVLASGRTLRPGIQAPDPAALLRALAERGVAAAATARRHPAVVYAAARAAHGRWRWTHLVARFPLFALGPTAVLFNAHQHIAYGGLLGEYYLLGLARYLETFLAFWATVTIYQVLYASVLRGLAEPICLLAAALAPGRAVAVRRTAELAIRVLYYGGVPALLALRFAPW
jgi:apolipoprotein N-acyltransferase